MDELLRILGIGGRRGGGQAVPGTYAQSGGREPQLGNPGFVSDMSSLGYYKNLMNEMGGTTDQSQDFGQPERMASMVGSLEEEPFDFGKFLMQGLANSAGAGQDFTQPVPIAGAQNVGVQRGNPLQTLLSSIQRRRQGQQGQQGILQRGFTGRV